MKKSFLLITVCFCLSFLACSGNDDNAPRLVNPTSYIKLTVAGKSWDSDPGVVIGVSLIGGKHNFTLSGVDKTFEGETSGFSAVFSSESDITPGTYVLDDLDGGASITKVNSKTYLTGSSSNFAIQITEVQGSGTAKKFKGTFSGELKGPTAGDVVTISNGEFSSL